LSSTFRGRDRDSRVAGLCPARLGSKARRGCGSFVPPANARKLVLERPPAHTRRAGGVVIPTPGTPLRGGVRGLKAAVRARSAGSRWEVVRPKVCPKTYCMTVVGAKRLRASRQNPRAGLTSRRLNSQWRSLLRPWCSSLQLQTPKFCLAQRRSSTKVDRPYPLTIWYQNTVSRMSGSSTEATPPTTQWKLLRI